MNLLCQVCKSTRLEKNSDGFLVCEYGHQVAGYVEEEIGFEQTFGTGRVARKRRRRDQEDEAKDDPFIVLLQSLQDALQHMTRIVEGIVKCSLEQTVKKLWLRRVSETERLKLPELIFILYSACKYHELAIVFGDFVRWIHNGTLPYLNLKPHINPQLVAKWTRPTVLNMMPNYMPFEFYQKYLASGREFIVNEQVFKRLLIFLKCPYRDLLERSKKLYAFLCNEFPKNELAKNICFSVACCVASTKVDIEKYQSLLHELKLERFERSILLDLTNQELDFYLQFCQKEIIPRIQVPNNSGISMNVQLGSNAFLPSLNSLNIVEFSTDIIIMHKRIDADNFKFLFNLLTEFCGLEQDCSKWFEDLLGQLGTTKNVYFY